MNQISGETRLGQMLDDTEQKNLISLIQEYAGIAENLEAFIEARARDLEAALGPQFSRFQAARRNVEAAAPGVEQLHDRLISPDPLLWYRVTPEERASLDAWSEGLEEMLHIYENLGRVTTTEARPGTEDGAVTTERKPELPAKGPSTETLLIAGGTVAALLLLAAVA